MWLARDQLELWMPHTSCWLWSLPEVWTDKQRSLKRLEKCRKFFENNFKWLTWVINVFLLRLPNDRINSETNNSTWKSEGGNLIILEIECKSNGCSHFKLCERIKFSYRIVLVNKSVVKWIHVDQNPLNAFEEDLKMLARDIKRVQTNVFFSSA